MSCEPTISISSDAIQDKLHYSDNLEEALESSIRMT
jgi:hypothetical protein